MSSIRDTRRPHDLYRFYDALDRLLYIGISLNAATRMSQHKTEKPWWGDVRRVQVTPLGVITRSEAERIERDAIADERPIHNVVHNGNRDTGGVLTWGCEMCGDPIKDGDGYIELPSSERRRYAAELNDWESRRPKPTHQTTSFDGVMDSPAAWKHVMSMPPKSHWWAIHRSCDPNIDGGGYWFDVSRIRSHADVLEWTTHLMAKRWIGDTDWLQLIGRVTATGSNGIIRTEHS